MIIDMFDYEFLSLCGICRYLPKGLQEKYSTPVLDGDVISNLQAHKLIKQQSGTGCYKLTTAGRQKLAEMGREFPCDAKPNIKRDAYRRKLINAEWNLLLYLSGTDIFFRNVREMSDCGTGYTSSLVIRAEKIKALAGTRFLGILKINTSAYIAYCIEDSDYWIVPVYEKTVFTAQTDSIGGITQIKLIVTGTDLPQLWEYLHQDEEPPVLPHGMTRFDKALEELGHDFLLVPFGECGVLQMKILQINRYKERIAAAMGCRSPTQDGLKYCDGVSEKIPYIIAVDFDVNRIVRALENLEKVSKTTPKICCLWFQKDTLFKMLAVHGCQKAVVVTIDEVNIYRIFPELAKTSQLRKPFVTKEGKYIEVTSKISRASKKEQNDKQDI